MFEGRTATFGVEGVSGVDVRLGSVDTRSSEGITAALWEIYCEAESPS